MIVDQLQLNGYVSVNKSTIDLLFIHIVYSQFVTSSRIYQNTFLQAQH